MRVAEQAMPRCPLCGADRTNSRFRHGTYTIFACRACRGGFAWPRLRPGELEGVYDEGYADSYISGAMHEVGFAQGRFRQLEKSLQGCSVDLSKGVGRRVLDVGCGSGQFAREFLRRGWLAEGVEISPLLAGEAKSSGLTVHVGDFLRLELSKSLYDLITMFHVIEHFDAASEAATKCHSLLRPSGVLVLETPNWRGIGALLRGSRWSHIIPPEHLNYFGPAALSRLVLRAGFSGASAVTVTPQVIQAAEGAPRWAQRVVRGVYQLATLLGIGTTLQVFAFKNDRSGRSDAQRAQREPR